VRKKAGAFVGILHIAVSDGGGVLTATEGHVRGHAASATCAHGRLRTFGAAQSSQRRPATRSNSLTFEVTRMAPSRRAWPASSTS